MLNYAIYGSAQMVTSIESLLQVGGAVLGTAINFLIPCVFYNRAYSETHLAKDEGAATSFAVLTE